MRKLFFFLCLALFALSSASAQNFTTITASNIADATGNKLAQGKICFQPTDANANPISFAMGGGGQALLRAVCKPVINGAISGTLSVANPVFTSPAAIAYTVTVYDTSISTSQPQIVYRLVQPTGATWSFDTYQPTGIMALPLSGGTILGPVTIGGVNPSLTINGFGSLAEIAAPGCIPAFDLIWGDSTAHRAKECDNNGSPVQIVHAGADVNNSDQVTATHLAAPLPVAQGGTAANSAPSGFNNLSPITSLGDIIYGSGTSANSRLAGNTSTTKEYLSQTGTGSASATPSWAQPSASDLSNGVSGSGPVALVNGAAFSSINGDRWVGPGTGCSANSSFYSSLSACYAALSAGQNCHICAGWSETFTANLSMNKSHTGFIFHGNATITMGSFSVVWSDLDGSSTKLIGTQIRGLNAPYDPAVPGVSFQYSGSGKAFQMGDGTGSGGSGNHLLDNIGIDLTSAGSSASGLYIQDPGDNYFQNLSVHTTTTSGASSQKGIVCDASAAGCQGNTFYGPLVASNTCFQFLSGAKSNHIYGGLCQPVATSGIGIDMQGNSNDIRTAINSAPGNAVQLANSSTVLGNDIQINNTSNTTDYAEVGGSGNASHDNTIKFLNATTTAQSSNLLNTVIIPGRKTGANTILNQQSASSASCGTVCTGNAADQVIWTYTLPANTLAAGKCLDVFFTYKHSTGTASTTYKLNFGSTSAMGSQTYAPNDNSHFDKWDVNICNDSGSQTSQANIYKDVIPNFTGFTWPAAMSNAPLSNPAINFANSQTIQLTFNVANTDQITPGTFKVTLVQ